MHVNFFFVNLFGKEYYTVAAFFLELIVSTLKICCKCKITLENLQITSTTYGKSILKNHFSKILYFYGQFFSSITVITNC